MIQLLEPRRREGIVASGWQGLRTSADRGRRPGGTARQVGPSAAGIPAGLDCGERRERVTIGVAVDADSARARRYAAAFAAQTGLDAGDRIVVDAVVGELALNILRFAGAGEFVFSSEWLDGRTGVVIVARDRGPGIPDVDRAMTDGFSTSGRPGLGLATARRLMDAFAVESAAGAGTTITMKKWRSSCR